MHEIAGQRAGANPPIVGAERDGGLDDRGRNFRDTWPADRSDQTGWFR